jgi:hypothetical protein
VEFRGGLAEIPTCEAGEKVADLHAAEWVRRMFESPIQAMSAHLQVWSRLCVGCANADVKAVALKNYSGRKSSNPMPEMTEFHYPISLKGRRMRLTSK